MDGASVGDAHDEGATFDEGADFERLRFLLADGDADVRGLAAVALASVADERATDILIGLLDDSDKRVVCMAAQSLGARGDRRATHSLIDLLKRGDVEERCSALSAIAQIGDGTAFAPVVVELFDSEDEIRRNAAAALGGLGDIRALEPLVQALHDSYPWVRANAALSLGALADASSAVPLLAAFECESEDFVRGDLLIALAGCDSSRVDVVLAALRDTGEPEKVRVSAAIALATLAQAHVLADEPTARAVLIDAASQSTLTDDVRAAAVWALGRFVPEQGTLDVLIAVLDDGYRWVVLYALESIALFRMDTALEPLREFRERHSDDDEMVRRADDAIKEIEDVRRPPVP